MRPDRLPRRPSLVATQHALLARITGRGAESGHPRVDDLIVGDGQASADARLAVYVHMYRARLTEALKSQFPRLAQRLGPSSFGELARGYFEDEPSRHPSLRFLGARLPEWLAGHPPEARALVGLAALEWARADVFDLIDEPTLTSDAVRAKEPERLGELPLRLVAAHRLLTVWGGSEALWSSPDAEVGDQVATGDTESLVVWRDGTVVYHRLVDDAERAALALTARGTSVGDLCESLSTDRRVEEAVAQVHGWLSIWLRDGLLAAAA